MELIPLKPSAQFGTVVRAHELSEDDIAELAEVLVDCVEDDASVSFMQPLSMDRAMAFWRTIAGEVAAGARALLLAYIENQLVGTVQLVLELPENQPHRAEVAKLLVRRSARGKGVGLELMRLIEDVARGCGKTLLVLDTASAAAEKIYQTLGWVRCGSIPDYALMPKGGPCATTIYYRQLAESARK